MLSPARPGRRRVGIGEHSYQRQVTRWPKDQPCPRCGAMPERKKNGYVLAEWCEMFGHRDTKGEPCRGVGHE